MAQCGLTEAQLIKIADALGGTRMTLAQALQKELGTEAAMEILCDGHDPKKSGTPSMAEFSGHVSYRKLSLFAKELSDYVDRCFFCGLFDHSDSMNKKEIPHTDDQILEVDVCYDCERFHMETGDWPETKLKWNLGGPEGDDGEVKT